MALGGKARGLQITIRSIFRGRQPDLLSGSRNPNLAHLPDTSPPLQGRNPLEDDVFEPDFL